MQVSTNHIDQGLDALLKTRFHGAANIRGIRYQILYSLLRAFELYDEDKRASSIRLEGIEDVDRLGLHSDDEYIQVKSSQNPWNWSKLKEPLLGFLKTYRAEPSSRFALVFDFQLSQDIARLAEFKSLSSKEKSRVGKKFHNMCHQIGASFDEAENLLSKLNIVSVTEEQIWEKLRLTISEVFELGSQAVDIYILVLVAKLLDWAKNRKTVFRENIDGVRVEIGQALSRENEFQAYGRGLIDKISWKVDANTADFFEGKGTRPGHIAAEVDIVRPTWLERIDKAIIASKVCILRSSSGQGKSSLLYRYAYERWSVDHTFILRVAESQEHVALVCSYLRFRTNLGLPILLLIDAAGWHTRLWPLIAQECAALGIRVLITIRNEDWYRFARESLTSYEILEPTLDLDEARQIFKTFQDKGKLHASIDSPEWAFEKIGKPHLLMEYIYLLTHGRILEDRLRDQLKQFTEQNEDPAKVEILRRTALADALGAPVFADKLLKGIQLRDDSQQLLQSLSGEYINVEAGLITGLHWVRSDHLAHILHEEYPNPASTALAILDAIHIDSIPTFVSNAMCRQGLDTDAFINGLVERAKTVDIRTVLAFLNGVFEAGERQFFDSNLNLFDKAYELLGPSGIFLLSAQFMPIVKLDTVGRMVEIFGDKGENFRKLQEIESMARKTNRGLDLCREFLHNIRLHIQSELLRSNLSETGRLFDWCFLCKINLPAWPTVQSNFLSQSDVFSLPLDSFCSFTQGLYRYDESRYKNWFSINRDDIISYLKLNTDCISLNVLDSILSIEFFLHSQIQDGGNEQAVSRLKKLRSAIPICERYQSQGIWPLPFGLKASNDETHKDMPKENLPFESDIDKNVVWRNVVERHYLPDSYYRYEEVWYTLRRQALLFVQGLSKGLQHILVGKRFNFQRVFEGGNLPVKLAESLKRIPDPPPQTSEALKKNLKDALKNWATHLQNFLFQSFQYLENRDRYEIGRLSVHNFLDAVKNLPEMHEAFARLFDNVPDYFGANELNTTESKDYSILAELLDAWIIDPPKTPQQNILNYVRTKRDRKHKEIFLHIHNAIAPLKEAGREIILPADIYVNHPLRYLPLAFSVTDPIQVVKELEHLIKVLVNISDVADIFWLVPVYNGKRFLEGGYHFSSSQIKEFKGNFEQWETLAPKELPKNIMNLLPPFQYYPLVKLQVYRAVNLLLGQIQALGEYYIKIESLKISSNRFEIKLYNRYRARYREMEIELGIAASKLEDFLRNEFQSQQNDANYMTVEGFLKILGEAANKSVIVDWIMSGNFNAKTIIDSLEQLVQL